MPTLRALLALLAVAVAADAQTPIADIVPEIDEDIFPIEVLRDQTVPPADVAEGCAAAPTGRTLVRFTLITTNAGTADVVLGDPGCPACQGDPPPVCTNPLFECSVAAGHGHAHFSRYALYEILAQADRPAVAVGRKQGFCIEDTLCLPRRYDCNFQGLSVGCRDAYFNFLGCQYVDVTDLPGGRYLLRVHVNYDRIIPESDYTNNTDTKPIELCDPIALPTLRLTRVEGRAGRLVARGRVVFARPPLEEPDPMRDGALVRLAGDGGPLLEVAIPGGDRHTGCRAGDGWRARRGGGRWVYDNRSGFLDAGCAIPAGGVTRLRIVRDAEGFAYTLRGRLGPLADPPPAAIDTTVVLGSTTGPCGTGRAEPCAVVARGRRLRCPGSPSGAFLERAPD